MLRGKILNPGIVDLSINSWLGVSNFQLVNARSRLLGRMKKNVDGSLVFGTLRNEISLSVQKKGNPKGGYDIMLIKNIISDLNGNEQYDYYPNPL